MAIATRIAQAHHPAGIQNHPARPLNMEKKCVRRIIDPEDFQALAAQLAGIDFAPGGVGDESPTPDAAGEGASFQFLVETAQVGADQVRRRGEDGCLIGTMAGQGAPQLGFVIPGEQALGRVPGPALGGGQKGAEPGFEKGPGRRMVPRRQAFRGGADGAPITQDAP